MKKRPFSLGSILTITTDIFLVNDISEIYELLKFMTNNDVYSHQIPRVANECKPFLFQQFPKLRDLHLDRLRDCETQEQKEKLISAWLNIQYEEFGISLEVEQLPPNENGQIDPIEELKDIFRKNGRDDKNILVIE